MILSGEKIKEAVKLGQIEISDFDPDKTGPNSYDLHLADEIMFYRYSVLDSTRVLGLDMKTEHSVQEFKIPSNGLILMPGTLYLARTKERTHTDHYVPMLEGRSSVGRMGLFIHVTAGFGDIGFNGHWTLELTCVQPIRIYPGIRIAQIYFHTILGDFKTYGKTNRNSKYQNSQGVVKSMLFKDFQTKDSKETPVQNNSVQLDPERKVKIFLRESPYDGQDCVVIAVGERLIRIYKKSKDPNGGWVVRYNEIPSNIMKEINGNSPTLIMQEEITYEDIKEVKVVWENSKDTVGETKNNSPQPKSLKSLLGELSVLLEPIKEKFDQDPNLYYAMMSMSQEFKRDMIRFFGILENLTIMSCRALQVAHRVATDSFYFVSCQEKWCYRINRDELHDLQLLCHGSTGYGPQQFCFKHPQEKAFDAFSEHILYILRESPQFSKKLFGTNFIDIKEKDLKVLAVLYHELASFGFEFPLKVRKVLKPIINFILNGSQEAKQGEKFESSEIRNWEGKYLGQRFYFHLDFSDLINTAVFYFSAKRDDDRVTALYRRMMWNLFSSHYTSEDEHCLAYQVKMIVRREHIYELFSEFYNLKKANLFELDSRLGKQLEISLNRILGFLKINHGEKPSKFFKRFGLNNIKKETYIYTEPEDHFAISRFQELCASVSSRVHQVQKLGMDLYAMMVHQLIDTHEDIMARVGPEQHCYNIKIPEVMRDFIVNFERSWNEDEFDCVMGELKEQLEENKNCQISISFKDVKTICGYINPKYIFLEREF